GRYLDEGEDALSPQQLHDAFEQCLREGHLIPICFVSARTGAGVKELLDVAARLLPNPAEGNPPPFVRGDGMPLRVSNDPAAHVIADVFKIINDPFVGKLHVEIDAAIPGDLAAVAKIEDIHFDAVLHDSHDEDRISLAPLAFPTPMYGLALEPKHKGQEQKLSNALARLAEEDPCFRVEHHKELNETVVRGLSDLHLKVMLERMRLRYAVEVETHPPRIAYRETIAAHAEGHHRHKKQTGGAGQFG